MTKTTEKKHTSKRWALKHPEQIRRLLTATINQLLAGSITREDSRAVGYLCGVMLNIFQFQRDADLDQRIKKLEALLTDVEADDEL